MNINKTIIGALVGSVIFVSTAFAEITVVNPQKPGGGTTAVSYTHLTLPTTD